MSYVKTSGLVLREVEYKEADKILTVLTADQGKLTVKARGARRKGSPLVAATQVLTYSGFSLFESRGRYTVDEAEAISLFPELRGDLDKLALASYFAQLLENLSDEDYASGVLLRLGLNSLYALCRLEKPLALVKAAFELKLMAVSGYEPALRACDRCGEEPEAPFFHCRRGVLACADCREAEAGWLPLSPAALRAMRHIVYGEEKKLFAFSLDQESLDNLAQVCETFLLVQLERGFSTLDFYKNLQGVPGTP